MTSLPPGVGPHDGKELELMLKGEKKCAIFGDVLSFSGDIPEDIIPEKAFAPHVDSGQFLRFVQDYKSLSGHIVRCVCFTVSTDSWRAHFLFWLRERLFSGHKKTDNADDVLEGRILGYSEEDIQAYLTHKNKYLSGFPSIVSVKNYLSMKVMRGVKMALHLGIGPHEGRELELMLEGTKKCALFRATVSDAIPESAIPETSFAPYVVSGRFVRMARDYAVAGRTIRYVCFCERDNAWRGAFLLWLKDRLHGGAVIDVADDIVEGRILGYTEDEIEKYLPPLKPSL